ncbi:MAG: F0F1 ATP synthase subunit A [Rhodospirillales bacterium]
MASPIEQFQITKILDIRVGTVDASFTNSSLFMVLAVVGITLFLILGVKERSLVPGRWQSLVELAYDFVGNMIRSNVGREGLKYFPFIFSLFLFVLFGNLLGLLPYSFTFTSHVAVTFALALTVFIGTTVLGFAKHGLHFFHFFLPKGTPLAIAPLLVSIEVLSYFTRPVSLSLRLFANMTAGHTLLKVFAGFVVVMGAAGVVPLVFVIALTGLELLVAFLQAFVFAVLTCIYLNDALHMH